MEFTPTKLIIDRSGRVFCISAGINEGMLEFSETGEFVGFSGANKVIANPIELLWKKLSSQEQNEGAIQFVPTEFSNLDVDASGSVSYTHLQREAMRLIYLNTRVKGVRIFECKRCPQNGERRMKDAKTWY